MTREEFLGHLKNKDMEFGCLYWEFARTGNREDIDCEDNWTSADYYFVLRTEESY